MTKIDVVRLIFLRHEDEQNTRNQLNLFHRRDTHVEKDTVENGHGNESQEFRQKHRKANANKDDEASDTLLADTEKLRLFTRCGRFRLEFQGNDMIDRENRCGNEPWKTKNGVNRNTDGHNQQIQMVTTAFLQWTDERWINEDISIEGSLPSVYSPFDWRSLRWFVDPWRSELLPVMRAQWRQTRYTAGSWRTDG